MFYTDDPIRDFERHDAELQRKIDRSPKCEHCGEHVYGEDYYYEINDDVVCFYCLRDYCEKHFKVLNKDRKVI